jgi:hypothetical protein
VVNGLKSGSSTLLVKDEFVRAPVTGKETFALGIVQVQLSGSVPLVSRAGKVLGRENSFMKS